MKRYAPYGSEDVGVLLLSERECLHQYWLLFIASVYAACPNNYVYAMTYLYLLDLLGDYRVRESVGVIIRNDEVRGSIPRSGTKKAVNNE